MKYNNSVSQEDMDLILSVLADPPGANMLKHTKLFTQAGGSLGRSADNDWVLPDPDRVVSSRHAQIAFSGNQYFLTDTSTNGTFYNGAEEMIGKGNQVSLKEGDILHMGEYRLKVTLRQPQAESHLPKGLGSADFLDTSDRTTFNSSTRAKIQNQNDARELDNWLEPGGGADISQSGEWGYIGSGTQQTPSSDSLLGVEAGPLDPLAAFDRPQAVATPDAPGLGGAVSQAGAGQWSDEDWWKDGSEQDHVSADQQAVHIAPEPPMEAQTPAQPQVAPSSPHQVPPEPSQPPPPQPQSAPGLSPSSPPMAPAQAQETPTQLTSHGAKAPHDNPFADSFAAVEGQSMAGAPGFGQAPSSGLGDSVASGHSSSQLQPQPPQLSRVEPPADPPQTPSATASVLATTLGLNMSPAQQQQADQQAAEIVRETVARLIDLLRARTSIKNELRVQRTMIQTEANNPLKFSATERDALEVMFAGNGAFMQPQDAVRDSFEDLSDHQVAVLAGMRAGYGAMLSYFNPENIERRLGDTSGVFGNKNARKWQGFSALYRELVGDPEACYRKLFGDEFAVTYENQLSELKNARQLQNESVERRKGVGRVEK
ncbi:type VI secretion system-associated FHA domain protein TagH [Microbulbifer spongiae]|uniref:Type VI secretion system-associated FHA domain protein TagH n=1 Tax=Microbulbifer spongiae TaxID=2944933 RepID=A0ABY9EF70_9GAMM|nr:type VI secretion system-associated FHA domain protein TagH [Microbulbifer sp. MI-G]WKD50015.1 type VI secretion system-associated FHA domain protein TagH [Microbulbifer sp. MI-G]